MDVRNDEESFVLCPGELPQEYGREGEGKQSKKKSIASKHELDSDLPESREESAAADGRNGARGRCWASLIGWRIFCRWKSSV